MILPNKAVPRGTGGVRLRQVFQSLALIAARFAPSADDVSAVRKFLESQNLKLVRTGPNNFYIRMRGTACRLSHVLSLT
jgi:subtilase family serine protease